ncbi:MAG: TRAM domain-containing protein [Anaerolineae bacterium]|nr:TRAM domain-containing protein [Anaerolineae bacterium]
MLSSEFIFRIIGMLIFALVGARLGVDAAVSFALPDTATAFIFSLVGILFGLIITPWITIRPIRFARKTINEMSIDVLFMALAGLLLGLVIGLLMAYPLSLLEGPGGHLLPTAFIVAAAYLGLTIFSIRSREIWTFLRDQWGAKASRRSLAMGGDRDLLLDTSVLIDGRVVEIAETGFLGGALVVPRFVLSELHQVADSSDPLRRARGRRGLAKLNELQRNEDVPLRIVDDDFEGVSEVDDKLVMLAIQMESPIITNDYNLNRVAEAQNVIVLNINVLANAVRSVYIPGETFPIHIIQEGKDADQGVGYLEDGTMVVIAGGKNHMDRTVNVTVTRLINKPTGRMIFADLSSS